MITACHNPAEYNGLKVVGRDGVEIPRLDEQRIERIFFDDAETRADWRAVGVAREEPSVVKNYIDGVLSKVNTKLIAKRNFSVVMDPGNGAQCVAAPYLVESMGCKLITLNSVLDGNFPGRGPEPTPETLADLSAVVKSIGADLGVAYDGDGRSEEHTSELQSRGHLVCRLLLEKKKKKKKKKLINRKKLT